MVQKLLSYKKKKYKSLHDLSHFPSWSPNHEKSYNVIQGSLTPGLHTGVGLQPVRNKATEQEVSDRPVRGASAVFAAVPQH